ncbi:hypothetical protein KSS87_005517 [Heliosperma pusillum]|nr:hypothetical protein KSS87_005517 [Heliosperma pusillum]
MSKEELGFLKPTVPSWKEQLARKTLRNVRLQGHTYVDLREDGKRFVFFCTLCLAPCYSDDVLFDHLRGNLHKERYSAAKVTLMGSNPWPFDDGLLFFRNWDDERKDEGSHGTENRGLVDERECVDSLAIVVKADFSNKDTHGNGNGNFVNDWDVGGDDDMVGFDLVIPGVIGKKDDISDLRVRLGGYGQITSRVLRRDEVNIGMQRIWCEWLGKRNSDADEIHSRISSHDFAIVTFRYFYDLGKQSLFDGIKTLLLTGGEDGDNGSSSRKRRKESFSDSEINSETQNYHPDSSGEDSQGSTSTRSSSLLVNRYDDHLVHSRIIPSKSLRRELRRQQRVASEKMCDICQQKMIAGKDVATLVNLKTGRLACSSRNVHGAFHVFHTSCLIHWILLCEFEMFMKPPVRLKVRRRSRRKVKSNLSQLEKPEAKTDSIKPNLLRKASETGTFCDRVCSVFCPDCQGTGIEVEGDELEKPTISLSEMFKYKIKMSDAHRAWMKCPEELENCSIGFTFPVQADNIETKIVGLRVLRIVGFVLAIVMSTEIGGHLRSIVNEGRSLQL